MVALVAAGLAVSPLSAAAVPAVSRQAAPSSHRQRSTGVATPPGPAEFARVVVGTTTAYAEAHGETERLSNVNCVEASSGHYMCSYAVTKPGRPRACHLMQAMWTPDAASSFTVTLSGRVARCATLRDAIRSLR